MKKFLVILPLLLLATSAQARLYRLQFDCTPLTQLVETDFGDYPGEIIKFSFTTKNTLEDHQNFSITFKDKERPYTVTAKPFTLDPNEESQYSEIYSFDWVFPGESTEADLNLILIYDEDSSETVATGHAFIADDFPFLFNCKVKSI